MGETITLPNGRTFNVVSSTPAAGLAKAKCKAHRMIVQSLDGQPVTSGTLTLSMPPPSVNSLFHNRTKGRGRTLAYRNWRAFADRELRDQPSWHVPGQVQILVKVGGSSADADNLLKATLDALVGAGRLAGDGPKHVAKASAEHDSNVTGTRIEITALPTTMAKAA